MLAFVTTELLTLVAVIALLVGVPVIVVTVIVIVSGYVRWDATRRLAELEETDDEPVFDRPDDD